MRYIIGIDLGTTNCAVSFVDTEQSSLSVQHFFIPQLGAAGKVDHLPSLPSFCYLAAPDEWPRGALKLPWKEETTTFVGQFAKIQGAKVPTRLIQSAKSWLCNVAANRRDKILPIEAADIGLRLSPVDASAKYLIHIRDAWNASMAKGNPALELESQEIILTVPASFDEVARTLTIEAAKIAGFLHLHLVEEPGAAFYNWISQNEKEWENRFKAGDLILVCDVGGGTTDFSLIEMVNQEGKLTFQRMAVGDHLLLGGDNIDAALAHYLEQKFRLKGHPPLETTQWLQLQAEARSAKEALLQPGTLPGQSYTILLQGTGSAVVGGSSAVEVARSEVEELLLDGFFGQYSLEEALQLRRSRGMRTMGLPYEDEPSIIKHLAHFLKQSHCLEKGRGIDYLLFNGGSLKPKIFQQAIEGALKSWFPKTSLELLASSSLDFSVSRGAAYYGKVRRGYGALIGGGTARTYYLKIDVKDVEGNRESKALTLLPRGSLEGQTFHPNQKFSLRQNTPVAFQLLTSHVRLQDREGDLIAIDPAEMQFLPPIQTILRFGRKQIQTEQGSTLPVELGIRLTAIGTVELWLESLTTDHKWQLEFQIRSAAGLDPLLLQTGTDLNDETFDKAYLEGAKRLIDSLFQTGSLLKPNQIMEKLESRIGAPRREWGPSLLRDLWSQLLQSAPKRKLSQEHEARWWNLAGFFLRPGFGYPLDDFRLKELWKIFLGELKTVKSTECLVQMWICLRRVAGGFNKGQQMQLANELIGTVFDKKSGKIELKRKGDEYLYSEKIRAFAALERLDIPLKIRAGEALAGRILHHSPLPCDYWSLGRIGARHLLYGSAGHAVPKETVAKWVEQLLHHQAAPDNRSAMLFLLKQLGRKTDHRELNLPEAIIQKILAAYPHEGLEEGFLEEKKMSFAQQELIFGDQLPAGLILECDSV